MYWSYVIVGYAVILASIVLYAWLVVRKGRQLSEKVSAERRRFLD
ncbi:MAG: hypothetical protein ACFCVK_02445 [Acidimicrobiales bacterium]